MKAGEGIKQKDLTRRQPEGKVGGQRRDKWEQKETLIWVTGAQCGVQMIFCSVVHLEPVWSCEPM